MPSTKITYDPPTASAALLQRRDGIQSGFIGKLHGLKYEHRSHLTIRHTLEQKSRGSSQLMKVIKFKDTLCGGSTTTLVCLQQSLSTFRQARCSN